MLPLQRAHHGCGFFTFTRPPCFHLRVPPRALLLPYAHPPSAPARLSRLCRVAPARKLPCLAGRLGYRCSGLCGARRWSSRNVSLCPLALTSRPSARGPCRGQVRRASAQEGAYENVFMGRMGVQCGAQVKISGAVLGCGGLGVPRWPLLAPGQYQHCVPPSQCVVAGRRLRAGIVTRQWDCLCCYVGLALLLGCVLFHRHISPFLPLANNQHPINSAFLIVCSSCRAPCMSKERWLSVFPVTNCENLPGQSWFWGEE